MCTKWLFSPHKFAWRELQFIHTTSHHHHLPLYKRKKKTVCYENTSSGNGRRKRTGQKYERNQEKRHSYLILSSTEKIQVYINFSSSSLLFLLLSSTLVDCDDIFCSVVVLVGRARIFIEARQLMKITRIFLCRSLRGKKLFLFCRQLSIFFFVEPESHIKVMRFG